MMNNDSDIQRQGIGGWGEKVNDEKEITDLTDDDVFNFDGDRVGIEDCLGENLIFKGMSTRPSDFHNGNYAVIEIRNEGNGDNNILMTSSAVLMEQIEKRRDKLPFRATIKEQKSVKGFNYYTLGLPNHSQ
ncbi:MAG: hypothetical protein MASP_01020 [Candidatus Methanolliviera sp. GoM_asphalt]|nr:MAG: hypothetical protein MASP_01020 [Candidatus Methanolliviera sp. GoM_asphalt]